MRVRPLAGDARRPAGRWNQAQPGCGGDQEAQGAEAWQSRPGKLPGQIVTLLYMYRQHPILLHCI